MVEMVGWRNCKTLRRDGADGNEAAPVVYL